MKFVIVIPDGLSDIRYAELNHRSPVEYAQTPALDALVRRGQVGLVQTMVPGLPLGSLVGVLGLLGYNPADYFPLGRALFEAHALGLTLDPADAVFRCNIVRIDQSGRLADFTAAQIDETSAKAYLAGITPAPPFELVHDLSYRNVLLWRNCPLDLERLQLMEPHEVVGQPVERLLPRYQGKHLDPLIRLMLTSRHDGLMLWPWGASRKRHFPSVPFRLGAVTALSFVAGMVNRLGGVAVVPAGATGYLNSDLNAKCRTLREWLPDIDVGLIHCNAPDEEAHLGRLQGKVQAIEAVDRQVIGPLLDYLAGQDEPYRLLVCPDHYTCCLDGKHRSIPVPYTVAGYALAPNHTLPGYSEVEIERLTTKIVKSHELLPALRRLQGID
jgi:2,3-bisphosphoglycerate-independent phosphoglycerate mutase